jgi:hypothetical protein
MRAGKGFKTFMVGDIEGAGATVNVADRDRVCRVAHAFAVSVA